MSTIHGFSDLKKEDKPKGQGFFNGGEKGGVEFYANDDANEAYRTAEKTASTNNGNSSHDPRKKDLILNVVMYKNGFIVNDGPLRNYEDPNNKQFIDDVTNGFIPQEYIQQAQHNNIAINLTNSTQTIFSGHTSTATTHSISFTGTGNSIGKSNATNFKVTGSIPTLDISKPTTNIKVRFIDGKQKVFKVNQDWTVSQIYALIKKETNINEFRLVAIPNRNIEMNEMTVMEAKIANSSLIQQK
ncbi:hypothetical protein ENUP19_0248G0093 [Entamoeba nuttalli]|uniref:SEP domain containing protein n=2 Tax=Entamoeba nuttalli TaxID=412467 RepID=K2GRI3_ENTNP|nr:SEP domain containing protein [Entamoeba nuttalli P19]EKE37563.1 SEP domain containing protein [Entamoeba nuttalli P19]|eukprot:XP_008860089.1 SEP domain containing protein [Entamoeba nuttalli P19]